MGRFVGEDERWGYIHVHEVRSILLGVELYRIYEWHMAFKDKTRELGYLRGNVRRKDTKNEGQIKKLNSDVWKWSPVKMVLSVGVSESGLSQQASNLEE